MTRNEVAIGVKRFADLDPAQRMGKLATLANAPAAAHTTAIAALHATVRHNNATIAGSGRMILTVDVGHGPVALLVLFNDPNFAHRPLDVRWDVCKVEAAAA